MPYERHLGYSITSDMPATEEGNRLMVHYLPLEAREVPCGLTGDDSSGPMTTTDYGHVTCTGCIEALDRGLLALFQRLGPPPE